MNLNKLFSISLIVTIFFVFGCNNSDENPTEPEIINEINESEILAKYLEENGNFINTSAPAMIKASDIKTILDLNEDLFVIDIRSEKDYLLGHIPGAVQVVASNVLEYYETNSLSSKETVVVTCYTGQGAGWVTSLLRLKGYSNVKDLKWGMCSWNSKTSSGWANSISNEYSSDLTKNVTSKPAVGSLPIIETGFTDAEAILDARVKLVISEGPTPMKISKADVMSNTAKYFIVNYWSETDYNWNHISGAIQYTPKQMLLDGDLNTLPTDKTIVVYCYTGQTSAHMAAYLRVLGYDARSLLYGMNSLSYDDMPGTRFVPDSEVHDYELEL